MPLTVRRFAVLLSQHDVGRRSARREVACPRRGEVVLRAVGHREGHHRRHRRREPASRGPRCTGCSRRQGRPLRRAAGARARGLLHPAARRASRVPTRSRTCSCAPSSCATHELRADEHLALMLASEPGETLGQLTVDGLPRIIRVATAFLIPLVEPYLAPAAARQLVDMLARLVISYFLAPSRARRPRRRTLGPRRSSAPIRHVLRGRPPADLQPRASPEHRP